MVEVVPEWKDKDYQEVEAAADNMMSSSVLILFSFKNKCKKIIDMSY